MDLIKKIKKSIQEGRLIETLYEKIYPYFKGFILLFVIRKKKIKTYSPKKNIIDKNDIPLAERIFKSFKNMKSQQENKSKLYKPSSMWQDHIDQDFKFMNDSVNQNDLEKFLFFLQNFGNWGRYLGIENQKLIKDYSRNFILNKYLKDEIFYSRHELWKFITQKNDISCLDFPKYGNQNGAYIDDTFVNLGSFFDDIYANIIKNFLQNNQKNIIIDLGAGYGKLGYYITKNLSNTTLVDIDIPETLCLASFYLSKCYPKKRNFFFGEGNIGSETFKNYDLIFLPSWEIEKISDDSIQLVVNKNSLGEMDPNAAENYLKHIHRISKYFFSMNHEFFKNKFNNNKTSLINSQFNKNKNFKELIRYPDLGHLIYKNNKINLKSDIFFYLYEKIN
tara:strand:- start:62 stop:1234 length:1173 start_codon:yes stop_codon:yes gene_type:complete